MSSYILKNNKEEHKVLLYQEKASYTFSPKKGYNEVKKITILDPNMLNTLWEHKIDKEYSKLLKLIYSLVSNDDTTSTDVLIAYTEIERIKEYLLTLKNKGLKKELLDKYLKKLYILELELKKIHVMELTEEIGKGR
ncbi:MAG: hypothetical protein KIC76_05190 [Firmicutes bacterium]|nr:hypothetical protein [Bacillota bacterium]